MILQAVPRSGAGYGGILLLCLIILVIFIVIKLIQNTPHKQPISKHLSNEEKQVKNNLYRADNNVKLCKQDNLEIEAFHIDDCINNKTREVSELEWSTLEMADLYLIKLNGGLNQSADAIKYSDAKISNSKLEINEKYNDVSVKISNYIKAGTTWKCTSKSIRGYDVKSYFVFLSNNEALWLLETPNGNTFPVGLGIYRHENNTCKLSYLASNPLHQKISMYYGDNDIDFYITIDNNANISILSNSNDPFLFDEKVYVLKKHKIHFKPSSSLVNQTWGVDIGEKPCITFKTEYEALIEESDYTSSVLYFCLDNEQGGYIAIKSGDNLSDENLIGTWRTGYKKIYNSDLMKEIESYFSEMRMHREGLDDVSNQEFIFIDCTIN